jgi:sirohydrochlorin cobaltochelatase
MTFAEDERALADLDSRLKIVLPTEYQESYESVQPVSMGSAGLKYAEDGQVAWDEIWDTFCDLAMAGGPPHKGSLLEPGTRSAIEAEPARYQVVVDEICRGITLVTDLPAAEAPVPGWVRVDCYSDVMAGWLLRAIVMENVAVRADGRALDLPAAPHFRLEKEIKNVVTVIAKTCHYYLGHMPRSQQRAIASLFASLATASPLVQPAAPGDGTQSDEDLRLASVIADAVYRETGLQASGRGYAGWLGLECSSVNAAVWMMRAMVVSNVLARREGVVLFVPVDPASDHDGARVSTTLVRIHRLARARGVL